MTKPEHVARNMEAYLKHGITLPPDPEEMNDERADFADVAIRAFMHATGTDEEDAAHDLICDLMHWLDRHPNRRGSTHEVVQVAIECYGDETYPNEDPNAEHPSAGQDDPV